MQEAGPGQMGWGTDFWFIFSRSVPVESLGALDPLPGALQWRIPAALAKGRDPPWKSLPGAMGSDRELQYGVLPR